MCIGAACNRCGAGCWNNAASHCEHASDERHEEPRVTAPVVNPYCGRVGCPGGSLHAHDPEIDPDPDAPVTVETLADADIESILDEGLDPNVWEDREIAAIIKSARNPLCHPPRLAEARRRICSWINARREAKLAARTSLAPTASASTSTTTGRAAR
jgi:hypothetical protein